MKRLSVMLSAIVLGTSSWAIGQTGCYVDENATNPTPDGMTWCSAYLVLQGCLNAANLPESTITEIRVAEGTYTPTGPGGPRTATFRLINGVAIRGGYAGCGAPDPDARDIELYETILSGDIYGEDWPDFENNDENVYHVVVSGSGTDATADALGNSLTHTGTVPHSNR